MRHHGMFVAFDSTWRSLAGVTVKRWFQPRAGLVMALERRTLALMRRDHSYLGFWTHFLRANALLCCLTPRKRKKCACSSLMAADKTVALCVSCAGTVHPMALRTQSCICDTSLRRTKLHIFCPRLRCPPATVACVFLALSHALSTTVSRRPLFQPA